MTLLFFLYFFKTYFFIFYGIYFSISFVPIIKLLLSNVLFINYYVLSWYQNTIILFYKIQILEGDFIKYLLY